MPGTRSENRAEARNRFGEHWEGDKWAVPGLIMQCEACPSTRVESSVPASNADTLVRREPEAPLLSSLAYVSCRMMAEFTASTAIICVIRLPTGGTSHMRATSVLLTAILGIPAGGAEMLPGLEIG